MAVLSRKQVESGQVSEPARVSIPEPVAEEVQAALPELTAPGRKKPKATDPWYMLEHPDTTDSHRITVTFDLDIDGESYKVEIERGRVETQEIKLRDELVKRGYRYMNEEF